MVLESGWLKEEANRYTLTGSLPPVSIPATLHDSLMARLDRLGPAKEVAQLGATLGREFPYELLKAVSSLDEAALRSALDQLVDAELLYRRRLPSHELYVFKHALIQETAYQSLLKKTREQSHKKIAQILQERFFEVREIQPELLAHHYTEAGLIDQAIPYWQKAGQQAVESSANVEAASHLHKGLELLKTLPHSPERIQQELLLQTTLGPALIATKGYGAPEVENTYARARELSQQMGEVPELFPVLWGLWVFYTARADHQTALELGEQCLRLAQSLPDPAFLLEAHHALAVTLAARAEFASALENATQVLVLYDPPVHRSHSFLYGQDPAMACLSHTAFALWFLGYPDQALQKVQQASRLAQELKHPFSVAAALAFAARLHQFRREGPATQEQAEAVIALCTEQGIPFWGGWALILHGWAWVEQGRQEEGMAQLRQGLVAFQATGAKIEEPYHLTLLAEGYGKVGQPEEGLATLAEGLTAVQNTKECWWEADMYRLKGELTLKQSEVRSLKPEVPTPQPLTPNTQPLTPSTQAEAEEYFHKAIEIAQRQGAKSLELRAVMSLSRLWLRQGKKAEARQRLAEIYGWFTEGFDLVDLQ
ncbi:MAG: hypothetical protein HY268_22960 [Deltaproteobacteria bacterium]|nr:hypothetical protein [Deltaproteobacteria bacterium]